jgi:hypothetical protein
MVILLFGSTIRLARAGLKYQIVFHHFETLDDPFDADTARWKTSSRGAGTSWSLAPQADMLALAPRRRPAMLSHAVGGHAMRKISITTLEEARPVSLPQGFAGTAETHALFRHDDDPLRVYLHTLRSDATLRIGVKDTDCIAYVWKGAVAAGGRSLAAASSLVVEHGAAFEIKGHDDRALLLTFEAARAPAAQRAGGHVHLLPAERVPRTASLAETTSGIGGGMHANAECPTCEIWLHENRFARPDTAPSLADLEKGVHSHSEDEVIFVTDGHIRLGKRLYGPGTAVAIAAETFYSFAVGPDGLKFINFRPARPSEIKIKSGGSMDEVAYWRDRLPAPEYLPPLM